MVDQITSWQPDPYGTHELRFFSADGKPTLLVMDGGKTSYDRPPTAMPTSATRSGSGPQSGSPPTTEPSAGLWSGAQASPERPADLKSEARPTLIAAAVPRIAGTAESENQVAPDPTVHNPEADIVAPKRTRHVVPAVIESAEARSPLDAEQREPEPLSQPLKIAYGVVFAVLALSVLGLAYVHLRPTGSGHSTQAAAPKTTTSSVPRTTTTTAALPTALQPGAEAAATALVSSWSTGNKAAALTVATPAAVAALFATPYTSGLAIDRGCSTTFMPIVCTFGPSGGASPTDPIYEIDATEAPGGWYVSTVRVEN